MVPEDLSARFRRLIPYEPPALAEISTGGDHDEVPAPEPTIADLLGFAGITDAVGLLSGGLPVLVRALADTTITDDLVDHATGEATTLTVDRGDVVRLPARVAAMALAYKFVELADQNFDTPNKEWPE